MKEASLLKIKVSKSLIEMAIFMEMVYGTIKTCIFKSAVTASSSAFHRHISIQKNVLSVTCAKQMLMNPI